jgi:hypothetical protein
LYDISSNGYRARLAGGSVPVRFEHAWEDGIHAITCEVCRIKYRIHEWAP